MTDFSSLVTPTPPPNVTGSGASSNGLPDWYQEYIRGVGGNALNLANQYSNTPLPARSVAGITPDQGQAYAQIRANQGNWLPYMANASSATQQVAPWAMSGMNTANRDVAGPAQSWNQSTANQYMSPYTQSVVDNIARLGNRNFSENIMPGINDQMIGNGQFGSTRNADVMARAGRDVQQDITGAQSNALQSGYGTAAGIFGQDAQRAQQQQALQASTALQGAQGVASGFTTQAQLMGGLAQSNSALGLGDAQALDAAGREQQQNQQTGYDANFQNDMMAYQQPWDVLNNTNSIVRGIQLPSAATYSTSTPATSGTPFGQSPLGALGAAYGALSTGRPTFTA